MCNLQNERDMKKVFRIMGLCALVALAATSCKKDEQKLTSSFKAELTQPTSNAKTHLSGSDLLWNEGDAIKVFDANGSNAYLFTTTDNNVAEATFTGEDDIDANQSYTAFYPADGASLSGTEVLLDLAATQTYAEGTFGNATYPMAATNTQANFTFHSTCGLLAIPVQGTGNIGSIELTSKTASENLAGQLRYDLSGNYLGLANGQATVTLNCGNLALDATNATTFYFVVPAGVFASGFKAVLKNGGTELYTLETTQPNTIAAETIRLMPEVEVSAVAVTTDPNATVGYTDATVNGSYTVPTGMSVTNLTGKTTYYARAFATNEAGTAYGDQVSFTTLQEGIVNSKAKFTINAAGDQVYFSKGNLQYIGSAATPYWKFAENQWDYLGNNGQGSSSQTADRDLFGWGTSGYNHGATAYQPWAISTSNSYYRAYGSSSANLYDQTGQADWGYNAIANGGNHENSGWRTLTINEWDYILNSRDNAVSMKGYGTVNSVNGMILLPDDWTLPEGLNFTTGEGGWYNIYSGEQWAQMEANGAVFLPAGGYRHQTSFHYVGTGGRYYSSSRGNGDDSVYRVTFTDGAPTAGYGYSSGPHYGVSVRLVLNAE